ncbi:MAG: copper resistance protein CopC, partial [Acidimicrobiales bacterium]
MTTGMRRLVGAMFVVVLALAGAARPAAAHTSLVISVPADGEIVERAPERMQLTFATKVDSRSLRLELRRADGGGIRQLDLAEPGGPSSFEQVAALPDLVPGPYVVSWLSVGPDGHRASGEIVFGVGAVALADLRTASAGGGGIDPWQLAGGIVRWVLIAALALATGGVLTTRWARHRPRAGPLVELIGQRAGSAAHAGLLLCGAILAARAGIVGWARVDLAGGSIGERIGDALVGPIVTALVVAVAVGLGAIELRRLRRRGGSPALLEGASVAALAAVALASAGLGHAGASEAGVPVLLAAGIHGLAAAAWLGPLLMAGLVIRDAGWRTAPTAERFDTARRAGRSVAPVAAGSFVALATTGVVLALVQGSWSEFSRTFQWTLGAKAALVVA